MPALDDPAVIGEPGLRTDLRMPLLAVVAWAAALLARTPEWVLLAVLCAAVTAGLGFCVRCRWGRTSLAAVTLVGLAVLTSALVRTEAVAAGPVARLAAERAAVEVVGVVSQDPRLVEGLYGAQAVVRLDVREVVGRGLRHRLSSPVLVLGDPGWASVPLGSRISTTGRLASADDPDLAALLPGASLPQVQEHPDVWWRGAEAVRASIRDSVAHRPPAQRALVPALVDGDDSGLDPGLEEDFRTTGLTHLTAVSGTNLTLIVGFLLVVARWCGVRGRWLTLVAAGGIVGFLLLARTEPSVVRAAAMGTVGLIALGSNGRQRALRGLGVAVVALLLVDPGLAVSPGFALSAMATGGIVLLAPGWRDTLVSWVPRWLAEAVAVPAAAQLACTPVVAALSGQVSLVAVPANLLVSPVVGPATVLGLAGGLVGLVPLVGDGLGQLLGTGAGWSVGWIVWVARTGARVPLAALDWGTGFWALVLLVTLCVALVVVVPLAVRSRWRAGRPRAGPRAVAVTLLAVLAAGVLLLRPGWWPGGRVDDWAVVMCDVGQGDALVLRAGPAAGVVIDAGPDPAAVDECLDRLGVEQVPLVVLTHFHADHVAGLDGVVDGRAVGAIWTTSLLDPPAAVDDVAGLAVAEGIPLTAPASGELQVGEVTLRALWPAESTPHLGPGDGSTANDASVVLVADVQGVRVLLTGDLEPPGQATLAPILAGLDVDVLKVPHHGSRHQDLDVLTSVEAEAALISAGADNDYGHPAPDVIAALEAAGAEVARTDVDGTIIVARDRGGLRLERVR
ncbi:ComEC/Rec2 family competence protein [Nocardioides sp.]|uniref:ComEC/Rec2 family competence protein n=1 Tax=Nocardioides sp. TaxID=35761 RepID=UPI002B26D7E1|nr:ComEC/Rec2 family competence protein [Nocardioides sp.]